MKIINKTIRDITADEHYIQKTAISDLTETTELPMSSLIHVIVNLGNGYESKKMSVDVFKQKIYDSIQNTFKTSYWDTHEKGSTIHNVIEAENIETRPKGTSFTNLLQFLKDKDASKEQETDLPIYAPEEVLATDPNGFINHLYFDFDLIKRYMVVKNEDIELSINKLTSKIDKSDCYFAPTMKFVTTALDNNMEVVVSSDTLNHNLTENDTYCQMSIESGNKISNEWTCPESGNLVIYGWLDTSACLNNKSTSSAFCVIEGNINKNWEILSVCPVAPAKNITYVGFNLMVKKGLVIRARTGFVCGVKSGQSSNQQDGFDTLANSKANGFKCIIYFSQEGTDNNDDS